MVPQDLRRLYNNWLQKADSYTGNNLSVHFDKFTSLYIVYNAMYVHVLVELANQGKPVAENFKDKTAAVDYVLQYIGSRIFITKLLDDEQSNLYLNTIIKMIENEEFDIILYWGKRQRDKDMILIENLRSTNNQIKGRAILTLFYHIRCNIFHGHKNFVPYQEKILKPINILLRKTLNIVLEKFDNI